MKVTVVRRTQITVVFQNSSSTKIVRSAEDWTRFLPVGEPFFAYVDGQLLEILWPGHLRGITPAGQINNILNNPYRADIEIRNQPGSYRAVSVQDE